MNETLIYKEYHKRRLPHQQPAGCDLFITFRLNFSLPQEVINSLFSYKNNLEKELMKKNDITLEDKKLIIYKKAFANYDSMLANYVKSPVDLTKQELAESLMNSLLENNNVLYHLHAFVIMQNHVHLLLKVAENELGVMYSLAYIMKHIKGSSARKLNMILGRQGRLWLREYYDHVVRNEVEFVNIINYIRMNPVKAGLVTNPIDWKWTWIAPGLTRKQL